MYLCWSSSLSFFFFFVMSRLDCINIAVFFFLFPLDIVFKERDQSLHSFHCNPYCLHFLNIYISIVSYLCHLIVEGLYMYLTVHWIEPVWLSRLAFAIITTQFNSHHCMGEWIERERMNTWTEVRPVRVRIWMKRGRHYCAGLWLNLYLSVCVTSITYT